MPSPENSFEASAKSNKKCPVCAVDLVMSERQGIEIDYCPECRGVWLDRGELDKIIKHSLQLQNTAPPDVGGTDRQHDDTSQNGDYRQEADYQQESDYQQERGYRQDDDYRQESGYRVGNHGGGHGRSRHGGGHGGGHGRRHGGGHGGGHYGRSWLQDLFH